MSQGLRRLLLERSTQMLHSEPRNPQLRLEAVRRNKPFSKVPNPLKSSPSDSHDSLSPHGPDSLFTSALHPPLLQEELQGPRWRVEGLQGPHLVGHLSTADRADLCWRTPDPSHQIYQITINPRLIQEAQVWGVARGMDIEDQVYKHLLL